MEKAKLKAQQGGYIENGKTDAEMLLDPLFFQSLGKAGGLGKCWACKGDKYRRDFFDETKLNMKAKCGNCDCTGLAVNEWEKFWHRFIDHVAEGKDVDSFFNNLLTQH